MKLGPYKQAVRDAVNAANAVRLDRDGEVRHEYPDYETYKSVQVAGNKAKLRMQFVKEPHIQALSQYLNETLGRSSFGLCHGTRRGLEQAWFLEHLDGAPDVIGTEISNTADQFANTVEWDFHNTHPNWRDRADFVYSNSWDHAFDPEKAFTTWAAQLRPGGLMLLDHTRGQTPQEANALDPFGVTQERFSEVLSNCLSAYGRLREVLDFSKNKTYRASVFVWQRAVAE